MRGMGNDARQRLAAQLLGRGLAHQHQGGGAVVDAGARCSRDRAVLLEGGLEAGDLVQLGLGRAFVDADRSEEHTSELQSPCNLVCRLLLEKKKMIFIAAKLSDSPNPFSKSTLFRRTTS